MANDYGLNFSPTNANQEQMAASPDTAPIQSAIQTLSLRMPRPGFAGGIAPSQLMQGPGSAAPGGMAPQGGPGGNLTAGGGIDIEALLRMILSGQFGQGGMGQLGPMSAGMGAPPTPNVTPGGGPPIVPPTLPGIQKGPHNMPESPFPVASAPPLGGVPPPELPPFSPGGPAPRPGGGTKQRQ